MEIIDLEMKEIHSIIGNKLKENLSNFKFNKLKKQMERNSELKIDIISWYMKKYIQNKHLLLSFTTLIRHKLIDELYEKLFNSKIGTENIILFNSHSLYESGKTSFDIKTMEDLNKTMIKVVEYYITEGNNFFSQFNKDNDFYKYTCIDKKLESWSEKPALKRIMLCYLVDKVKIDEIHRYNIECCTSASSGTDFYIKKYEEGIKTLNEYYGEK
jgi:hypothetical protein